MRVLLYFLPTVAGLVLLQAASFATAQTVLYDKSRVSCVSRQMNVPVEAQFKKFSARIAFDPAKPDAGNAQIEIDVGSFDIDNAEVNDEAKSKTWFDVRAFPKATFVSSGIKPLGGGRYEARGQLTIKGRTGDVIAPFTYRESAGNGVFEGAFSIKRLQYNIGEGAWKDTDTVADDVQIRFSFAVTRNAPAAKK